MKLFIRILKALFAGVMATFSSPEELQECGCCDLYYRGKKETFRKFKKHYKKATPNQKEHIIALMRKAHKTTKFKPPINNGKE